jgi:hypothetical protein
MPREHNAGLPGHQHLLAPGGLSGPFGRSTPSSPTLNRRERGVARVGARESNWERRPEPNENGRASLRGSRQAELELAGNLL